VGFAARCRLVPSGLCRRSVLGGMCGRPVQRAASDLFLPAPTTPSVPSSPSTVSTRPPTRRDAVRAVARAGNRGAWRPGCAKECRQQRRRRRRWHGVFLGTCGTGSARRAKPVDVAKPRLSGEAGVKFERNEAGDAEFTKRCESQVRADRGW
jgi:hypothetical protein